MPDPNDTTSPQEPTPVDPNDDLVTQIEAKAKAVHDGLQLIRDTTSTLSAESADAKAKILAATSQVQADHDAHTKLVTELVTQLADEEDDVPPNAPTPADPSTPPARRRR